MFGSMSIFEEYSPSDKDAKLTLAGDVKEWLGSKFTLIQ